MIDITLLNSPRSSYFRTQFFIVHRNEEREQQMLTDNRKEVSKCMGGKTLEKLLGLRLCADVSYPSTSKADAPHFPLTGPISASIALHKVDNHKSYDFEARLQTTKVRNEVFVPSK